MLLKKPFQQNRHMIKVAITGGIGSGKSYVCSEIEKVGYPVFYCDAVAKHILRTNKRVQNELSKLVGANLYDESGRLVKSVLAVYLCRGKKYAHLIDSIVHPHVRTAFAEWVTQQSSPIVFMECALLYEAAFDDLVEKVITVSAPKELRISRLMKRDKISRIEALGWMSLQLSQEEKDARADIVIYNDGSQSLAKQIESVLTRLLNT